MPGKAAGGGRVNHPGQPLSGWPDHSAPLSKQELRNPRRREPVQAGFFPSVICACTVLLQSMLLARVYKGRWDSLYSQLRAQKENPENQLSCRKPFEGHFQPGLCCFRSKYGPPVLSYLSGNTTGKKSRTLSRNRLAS